MESMPACNPPSVLQVKTADCTDCTARIRVGSVAIVAKFASYSGGVQL